MENLQFRGESVTRGMLRQVALLPALLLVLSCTDAADPNMDAYDLMDEADSDLDVGADGLPENCAAVPANPNTNASTRNVLCYLHAVKGKRVLSGQQNCHWSPAPGDVEYIYSITGEYPAIVGGDFLTSDVVSKAKAAFTDGSLPLLRYHMGRPEDEDSYESSKGETDLQDTLTPGTRRYAGLMEKFDRAAGGLQSLAAAGVPVLWAPFHEARKDGWFWWSRGSGEQYQQLWRLMFEDFLARGVNNVLWLLPFSSSPESDFYPGDDYVDLAGADTYQAGQPFAKMYINTADVVGDLIPISLHETGQIPSPEEMFSVNSAAPWIFFNLWCDSFLLDKVLNPKSAIQAAYGHERTINRADLPDFKAVR